MGQSEIPLNRLIHDHPAVWQQLVSFRELHDKPVPGRQFAAWAESVLEDVRRHGEQMVDEALETTIESFSLLEWPFKFYRGVVKRLADAKDNPASAAPEQARSGESVVASVYARAGIADLVSRAKEGML